MNMNKKAALLTVILLSPVCMYGMESSTSLGTKAYKLVTLADVQHPKATKFRLELNKSIELQKTQENGDENNQFSKQLQAFNHEETGYKPVNRQRFWYATMITGVSAGTGLAAWYLAPKDPVAHKVVIGSAAVAGTSLLAACGFGYKAGKDADLAIAAAKEAGVADSEDNL